MTVYQPTYSHHVLTLDEGYDEYDLFGAFQNYGIQGEYADAESQERAHKALLVIRDGITTKSGSETFAVSNGFGNNVIDNMVEFYEEYESRKINNEPLSASVASSFDDSYSTIHNILFPSYPPTHFDYTTLHGPKNNLKEKLSHTFAPIDENQVEDSWANSLNGGSSGGGIPISISTLDLDTEILIQEDVEDIYEWGLSIMDDDRYDDYFGDNYDPKWKKFESKWLNNLNSANFDIEDNPGSYYIEFKARKTGSDAPARYKKQIWFTVP